MDQVVAPGPRVGEGFENDRPPGPPCEQWGGVGGEWSTESLKTVTKPTKSPSETDSANGLNPARTHIGT